MIERPLDSDQWRLTEEEDADRATQAAAGMTDFMRQLTEAIEEQQRGQKDPEHE